MMRLIGAATGAAVLCGGAAAGGTAMQGMGAVLSPPLAVGTPGASVEDGPHDVAVVAAKPGTSVLAVVTGDLSSAAPGDLRIDGTGDDAGLMVEYAGMEVAVAMPSRSLTDAAPVAVKRGDVIGRIAAPALPAAAQPASPTSAPPMPTPVTVRAFLDGAPLDAPALLRASLHGSVDWAGDWTRPVQGANISQRYGCTVYAFEPVDRSCPTGHTHTGLDLAVPMGTPVHAALPGVVHVVLSATGYGLHVIIDHGGGLTTLYAHLESASVHDGDEVDAGDVIGIAGSTGNSTGPHLHFEVRRDGIPEDPELDIELP